jgi:uncharacterized integral membrane protein
MEGTMKAKLIAILVVVLLALIILIQNAHRVTFRLLFWTAEISQLLLVLLVLAIGFVLGFLIAKLTGRRRPPRGEVR